MNYHPEPYWDEVAERIAEREDLKIIAGDDEPYYRYKRKRFLRLLHAIDFRNKVVLEIGSGPGGNLAELLKKGAAEIHGADVSARMVEMSSRLLGAAATITKTDGLHLPYPDACFDICFTSTVLQHNTDEAMLAALVREIARVAKTDLYLFEKIEKRRKGTELCMGRPVAHYEALFRPLGFELEETRFLGIEASFFVSGAIRKLLNKPGRKEGEPISGIARLMQNITLPLTSVVDRLLNTRRDLAMLHFKASGREP